MQFDTRFLVDVTAYLKMHGTDEKSSRANENKRDDLGTNAMASKNPPDHLLYLFPPNIYGFDIMEKKWVNLRVDCISPIRWNKSAFETLELKPESKMLIRALVSNKIAADRATDMVSGKGTGLIVLLHGGPGTGKTLTAESVAEIAEKPLYRVTCGDIGIEPREVEKYLESVFYLGRIWDCVVLLDEADVFLEQRSLEDLARNALVSVFLRTLEYYSGILILTSNRVGTFDEAFKSRIQLALHYKNLDQPQRAQIWTNFITRLQDLNESMDADGILAKVKDLSEYPMNGRQIRNAITTARQLALYNDEPLNVGHLQHSIAVSGEFDKYLIKVKGDVDDDELAKEEGYRVP
ncbi:ATP-dependent zinc metalloprotease FtsH [Lasiodiplodia theobromae]|uniref:ATP-dependent zinc metalloprotease FtsH n=1 Tax=Lasiodiplodia theobromae TaxID=45133 RepID=A0A5N5D0Q9_9PEZI|nr:ATP-dependent zinc metalloprotease FtsH [Lasiodiplodia theobromae]